MRRAPIEGVAESGWHIVQPLIAINDWEQIYKETPVYLVAEVVFFALFVCMCLMILTAEAKRRRFLLLAALVTFSGGICVELVTILHQQVGNFYHTQAVIMLFGYREPLYMILGCYTWIGFTCLVLADRAKNCGVIPHVALGCLLAHAAWGLLDMVGAKFLWWTWHNAEPLYADRHWGVPIASSFWIMATGGASVVVMRWFENSNPLMGLIAGPLASLGLMNVPFLIFYHPIVTFGGYNANVALDALRAACVLSLLPSLNIVVPQKIDLSMTLQVLLYVGFMLEVVFTCNPREQIRISYGQPCAANCNLQEQAFWGGFIRGRHICPGNSDFARDNFELCDDECSEANLRADGFDEKHWYRLCGTPMLPGFKAAVSCTVALLLILSFVPFKEESHTTIKGSEVTTEEKTEKKKQ